MTTDAPDVPGDASDGPADEPTPVDEERAADDGTSGRKHLPVWQESILLLAIALGLAVVIKTFFVQAFYIPSESMLPGLQGGPEYPTGDRILVEKPSYWFGGDPSRGDVIVFEDPGGWLQGEEPAPTGLANVLSKIGLYPTGGHLVKRVIGTEGDIIECCDDEGRILVNGEPVDESDYIAKRDKCAGHSTYPGLQCNWSIGPIPAGKLFVMGDNRGQSADSRAHVCGRHEDPCSKSPWVDTELVVGKVFALVWPQDRWDWIGTADAFDDVPDEPSDEVIDRVADDDKSNQR